METIEKHQLVTEYVGEAITQEEAEERGKVYDSCGQTYLFDLDFNEGECLYTLDAKKYGNISHFINHSVRMLSVESFDTNKFILWTTLHTSSCVIMKTFSFKFLVFVHFFNPLSPRSWSLEQATVLQEAMQWPEGLLKYFCKVHKFWSDLIRTCHRKWMNMWKSTKVYTAFLFMGHAFWKENIEDSKIIGINCFELLYKGNNGQFAWNRS